MDDELVQQIAKALQETFDSDILDENDQFWKDAAERLLDVLENEGIVLS